MAVEFRCQDVGVACKNVARAETADELVAAVAKHARDAHGVELNQTLIDYAVTKVRPVRG
jgi:predicted small metal-binding protein